MEKTRQNRPGGFRAVTSLGVAFGLPISLVLLVGTLTACGPAVIGAALSGGSGSNDPSPIVVLFSEVEPNDDRVQANLVGDAVPGFTFVVSGETGNNFTEADFFDLRGGPESDKVIILTPEDPFVDVDFSVFNDGQPNPFVVKNGLPQPPDGIETAVIFGAAGFSIEVTGGSATPYTLEIRVTECTFCSSVPVVTIDDPDVVVSRSRAFLVPEHGPVTEVDVRVARPVALPNAPVRCTSLRPVDNCLAPTSAP